MQVPMTPIRILRRAVKLYPGKTAVVDGEIRLTYSQVQQRVNQVTNAIYNLGIQPGGRIAALDYNSHRYMELYFGAAQSGRVLLPLNTQLSADEYAYILDNAEAEAVIFHADFKTTMDQVRKRTQTVKYFFIAEGEEDVAWMSGTYEKLLADQSVDAQITEPDDENDMLNLYYTSGTTGRPKGVMLTHRNIYANALSTIIAFKLEDSTIWHHIAPLFHLADAFFIWSVTYQGGRHIMNRQFRPKAVIQKMEQERVTCAMMVPTMINCLLDTPNIEQCDLSSLKWIMVGGAPMSPANARRMMEKLGCQYLSGYGLTETCPLLTVGNLKDTLSDLPLDAQLQHITRTGLEVVGVDLRVVDKEGQDVPWDAKSVGEIIVRGDNVMKGYWKLPEETANAFKDGYFYTGDLANVDAEGYVHIVDRSKDIIIRSGENIASVEIENFLYTHPQILECAVIAVPDKRWGEVPKALVVRKQDADVTEKELTRYCRDGLARFKVPKFVEFVNALPKTGSGKIVKAQLRKVYGAGE